MTSQTLAVLGGHPVRTRPFQISPCVDTDELDRVTCSIQKGNFSRYIGAYSDNLDNILSLKSNEEAIL